MTRCGPDSNQDMLDFQNFWQMSNEYLIFRKNHVIAIYKGYQKKYTKIMKNRHDSYFSLSLV